MTVAALFVRADSVYKTMPGVDCWDIERDARTWPGGCPVVAHPPCPQWSRLRAFARVDEATKQLARDAVQHVRTFGGVMEHPASSALWADQGLPLPGRAPDAFGGWTCQIRQCDWGHKAEKLTWLYIVGIHPDELPTVPQRGWPTHVVTTKQRNPLLPECSRPEREHTPPQLAAWLVELASRCKSPREFDLAPA